MNSPENQKRDLSISNNKGLFSLEPDDVSILSRVAFYSPISKRTPREYEIIFNTPCTVLNVLPINADEYSAPPRNVLWGDIVNNPDMQDCLNCNEKTKNLFRRRQTLIRTLSGEYVLQNVPVLDMQKRKNVLEWAVEFYKFLRKSQAPKKDFMDILLDAIPCTLQSTVKTLENHNEAIARIIGKCFDTRMLSECLVFNQRKYIKIENYRKVLEIFYLYSSEALKKPEEERRKDLSEAFFLGLCPKIKATLSLDKKPFGIDTVTEAIVEMETAYLEVFKAQAVLKPKKSPHPPIRNNGPSFYLAPEDRNKSVTDLTKYFEMIEKALAYERKFVHKDRRFLLPIEPKHRKVYKEIRSLLENYIRVSKSPSFYGRRYYSMILAVAATNSPIENKEYAVKPEQIRKTRQLLKELEEEKSIERADPKRKVGIVSPAYVKEYPDGNIKILVDFSILNRVIKTDKNPFKGVLPTIMEIPPFQKVFSVVYLGKLHFQIGMDKESRKHTTFSIFGEKWVFLRMPEGFAGTSATFYNIVKAAISPLKCTAQLLDAVIVFSDSMERHMGYIKALLCLFENFRVTVNVEKTRLFMPSAVYANYVINEWGVHMQTTYISKIRLKAPPCTVGGVEYLLGVLNRHREFVHDFTVKTSAIYRKIADKRGMKEEAVVWTKEDEEARVKILDIILARIVLGFPLPEEPFQVCTYYSGGLLDVSMVFIQGRRLIGFFSHRLKDSTEGWMPEERELYAIYLGLKKFKNILKASVVFVYSRLTNIAGTSGKITKRMRKLRNKIEKFCVRLMHIDQAGKTELIGFVNTWINKKNATEFIPIPDSEDPIIQNIKKKSLLLWESSDINSLLDSLDNQEK